MWRLSKSDLLVTFPHRPPREHMCSECMTERHSWLGLNTTTPHTTIFLTLKQVCRTCTLARNLHMHGYPSRSLCTGSDRTKSSTVENNTNTLTEKQNRYKTVSQTTNTQPTEKTHLEENASHQTTTGITSKHRACMPFFSVGDFRFDPYVVLIFTMLVNVVILGYRKMR